jgi:hypothetical protein
MFIETTCKKCALRDCGLLTNCFLKAFSLSCFLRLRLVVSFTPTYYPPLLYTITLHTLSSMEYRPELTQQQM